MQSPKSLRKPLNWQDFETLCKKLWGEIWKCEEIKKNGRSGQNQHGVDVFGIPTGEKSYYGIQCKGKDEYANKQFTEQEVIDEVEKAKMFKPTLKKLYFATTANKDAVIEEFVRLKNLEHIEANLFEVHLFSWEDIVDLIDENRQTYSYYLENQNFRDTRSVEVTFANDENEIVLKPKFKHNITVYARDYSVEMNKNLMDITAMMGAVNSTNKLYEAAASVRMKRAKINLSYASFRIRIRNTGSEALEDYKLSFKILGDIKDIAKDNITGDIMALVSSARVIRPTTYVNSLDMTGDLVPNSTTLVGDDYFESRDIFIKPAPYTLELNLEWKLLTKHFKKEGTLKIIIEADIKKVYKEITVEESTEEKRISGDFEDFIESLDK